MASAEDFERLGAWAVIKDPDKNINRRECSRQVPMQVLSLGAPRTGTLSMSEAYSILGIPSYHYASLFSNCKDADMWQTAMKAKYSPDGETSAFTKANFDQLLGHVSAVTDAPCILFWQELIAAYPDAKVVLVERDEEKWLKSIQGVVTGVLNPVGRYVLRFTDPYRTGRILGCGMAWIRNWFAVEGPLTVDAVMKNARATYRNHYADIRKAVPKDRLLDYKLGSGWGPLCEFIGKDIPHVPFPHRNDAATLDLAFGAFLKSAFLQSGINLGIFMVGSGILWQSWYMFSG